MMWRRVQALRKCGGQEEGSRSKTCDSGAESVGACDAPFPPKGKRMVQLWHWRKVRANGNKNKAEPG